MNNPDFSAAIKKIREDVKLYGKSRNHLAEPLKRYGYDATVTDNNNTKGNFNKG